MTISLYKISRGKYKLIVFNNGQVETFRIKGKNEAKRKRKALEELYGKAATRGVAP